MRLRVSTEGRSLFVDVDDSKGHELFNDVARVMLGLKQKSEGIINPDSGKSIAFFEEAKPLPGSDYSVIDPQLAQEVIDEACDEAPGWKPRPYLTEMVEGMKEVNPMFKSNKKPVVVAPAYKGFLHIKCSCGAEKSFCSKMSLSHYKCNQCGEKLALTRMTKLYAHCECGKRTVYQTNREDELFDVTCIGCGAPIAVQYNAKKEVYGTCR